MVIVPSSSGSSFAAASKQSRKGLRLSLITLAMTSLVRVSAPPLPPSAAAVPFLASASPSQASSVPLGAGAVGLLLGASLTGCGAGGGLRGGGSLFAPHPFAQSRNSTPGTNSETIGARAMSASYPDLAAVV